MALEAADAWTDVLFGKLEMLVAAMSAITFLFMMAERNEANRILANGLKGDLPYVMSSTSS
ncbi:hypothetical protein GCM10027288_18670 [Bordetella tumbae]